MKTQPQILITNDDGIHAPGIRHLWNSLKDKNGLYIVAPAYEQSGVGAGISLRNPLQVKEIEWSPCTSSWSVGGTPADCVKLAVSVLLKFTPHIIVSGINRGSNAGRNVLYSGTIGGVIEGVLRGIPGIAFSAYDYYEDVNYALFESYIPLIVNYVLQYPLPAGTMLNVNFPSMNPRKRKDKGQGIHGIKLTRQGKQYVLEDPEKISYNALAASYTLGPQLVEFDEHEESDIYWLERGYVTIVPVHVEELTDWKYLRTQKEHLESFVSHNNSPYA